MEAELELIKRRLLKEMISPRPVEKKCPYEGRADKTSMDIALKQCQVAVVDFWAEWCAPCRLTSPIVEEVAEKFAGRVAVLKVNVDENPEVAAVYDVMSIPTIIVFWRGREFKRFVGYSPFLRGELEKAIMRLMV
ncbi:thioredoxin [Infirmifilum lucidum]|nr:thioredoxin [Infirmifilum lucidum]